MTLTNIATGNLFDTNSISTDLIAIFTHKPDSEFAQKQLDFLTSQKEELLSQNLTVLFVVDESVESNNENYFLDENRDLLNLAPKIQEQTQLGENLLIFRKKDEEIEYIDIKESPENEYDWIEALAGLCRNYQLTEPDDDSYWRWGQVVHEDGEYLCKDCGFVLELKAGDIFPICEVCLAGEPSGPSTVEEGYWERI